jgi:hypothetical protein
VEPPAPKVTEKNSGLSVASRLRVAASFSTPSLVCGGKNSKLICELLIYETFKIQNFASICFADCLPESFGMERKEPRSE